MTTEAHKKSHNQLSLCIALIFLSPSGAAGFHKPQQTRQDSQRVISVLLVGQVNSTMALLQVVTLTYKIYIQI